MNSDVKRVAAVLVLVTALTLLAGLLEQAGAFERLAAALARRAGSPLLLLLVVCALAIVVTVLLGLDGAAVLLTPVAVALAARARVVAWPYLLSVVWLACTASLLLPVSNLTNLLAAQRSGLDPPGFAAVSVRAWLASVAVTVGLLVVVSLRALRPTGAALPGPEAGRAKDPGLLPASLAAVVALVMMLAVSLPAECAAAAAAFPLAALALVRSGRGALRGLVPWRVLAGATALLAVVGLAGPVGLNTGVRNLLGDRPSPTRTAVTTALLGNAVDNLPAYLAVERVMPDDGLLPVLLGANLGVLLTPWGSLSTLLWAAACRRAGARVPWRRMLPLSALLVPLVLTAALAASR